MKKLIALVVVMLLPLGVFAQDKVAFVYTQEVMVTMPEYKEVQKKLTELGETYRKEGQVYDDEFKRKYADFIAQQDSLTENIKNRRMQELQELQERIQNYMQFVEEDMQKKQQELSQPVLEKLRTAIKAVGAEKGYLYIIEPGALLYFSNKVEDATPFVKAKLGI